MTTSLSGRTPAAGALDNRPGRVAEAAPAGLSSETEAEAAGAINIEVASVIAGATAACGESVDFTTGRVIFTTGIETLLRLAERKLAWPADERSGEG